MDYGFVKVAAAAPMVSVADCQANTREIERLIGKAEEEGVEIGVG